MQNNKQVGIPRKTSNKKWENFSKGKRGETCACHYCYEANFIIRNLKNDAKKESKTTQ